MTSTSPSSEHEIQPDVSGNENQTEESQERKKSYLSKEYDDGKKRLRKLWTLFKLFRYMDKRQKLLMIISILAAVANGALLPVNAATVLAPAVGIFVEEERSLYDSSSHPGVINLPEQLKLYGYIFYGYAISAIIIGITQITLAERCAQSVILRIKTVYLNKLLSINMDWFDKNEETFVRSISHDLQNMKGILDSRMTSTVEIIAFFVAGNIVGFIGSLKVALLSFVILMITLAVIYMFMQLSKRFGRKQKEYYNILTKLISEVLGNIRTVAAYGGETIELKRFELPFSKYEKYGLLQAAILTIARAFNYLILCVSYAAAFFMAAWLYTKDDFSPTMLAIVLNGLNMEIKPGRVTAVVGTSGAGKSTIVGLLTRLYDINSGQITIDGIDIKEMNLRWLRNQIGVVMQEPSLFDTTIEENIRFGKPDASQEEIETAAKMAFAHDFISDLPKGYKSMTGEGGSKLSGGQKQRISLARALVRRPGLLLLDEATSALDTRSEALVQKALQSAMVGRTALIIAHRMATVRNAHLIYVMKDGKVIESGSHEELLVKRGCYYNLFKAQEMEEKDSAKRRASEISETPSQETNKQEPNFSDDIENKIIDSEKTNVALRTYINMALIGVLLVALIFCFVSSAFLPVFHYVFSRLLQTFSHSTTEVMQLAEENVIILLIVGVVAFISIVTAGVSSSRATQIWLGTIRKATYSKVITMDISWFDFKGNSQIEAADVLINGTTSIEMVLGDRGAQVIIFFLSLIFSFVYIMFLNRTVMLVNLPIIIIFVLINALKMKTTKSERIAAKLLDQSRKVATEYIQKVKTVQLLNCQNYIVPQYEALLRKYRKEALKGVYFFAFVYASSKALIRLTMGSSFIFSATLILQGKIQGTLLVGSIISLSAASLLAGPSVIVLSHVPAANQALKRFSTLLQKKDKINVFSNTGLRPRIQGNILFKDVKFCYPTRKKVQILNGLNLEIKAGQTIALVGHSGCGKSTIISLLERFYVPSSGDIIVDGVNINEINVGYLRQHMGLVSQEPILFDLTVRENIAYGQKEPVHDEDIFEAAKIANIHNSVLQLPQGYDTMVGEKGSKLSGGQKQRIAIARAVLRDPKVLLLDEATSALDTESEKIVQEALEKASLGRTTIIIAHRLSTIMKADKIVLLSNGKVVEQGTHEQLLSQQGHYYNLIHER